MSLITYQALICAQWHGCTAACYECLSLLIVIFLQGTVIYFYGLEPSTLAVIGRCTRFCWLFGRLLEYIAIYRAQLDKLVSRVILKFESS